MKLNRKPRFCFLNRTEKCLNHDSPIEYALLLVLQNQRKFTIDYRIESEAHMDYNIDCCNLNFKSYVLLSTCIYTSCTLKYPPLYQI